MKSHQYKSLLYVAKKCGSVHFDYIAEVTKGV